MEDEFDIIAKRYKQYIESNSVYAPKVAKYNTNTSTYFPFISIDKSDNRDDDTSTQDNIDFYEWMYLTINFYTKDKKINGQLIPAQVIDKELENLTLKFFKMLNFQKTQNTPTPNLDTSIFRRTMQYQGKISNRGNIIRR